MRHLRLLRYVDEVARAGSIRKAAERLNLTASALNRRVQDIEEDLGTRIFERLPRGVRLNAAGELLIRHIRGQLADMSRVKSQIEDLSGFRRGTVSIACSQALAYDLLPSAIAAYRSEFPLVEFQVKVRDHGDALRALADFEVDLALVFRPSLMTPFRCPGFPRPRWEILPTTFPPTFISVIPPKVITTSTVASFWTSCQ